MQGTLLFGTVYEYFEITLLHNFCVVLKFSLSTYLFHVKIVKMNKKSKNICIKSKKNKNKENCIDNLERQDYNKHIVNEATE